MKKLCLILLLPLVTSCMIEYIYDFPTIYVNDCSDDIVMTYYYCDANNADNTLSNSIIHIKRGEYVTLIFHKEWFSPLQHGCGYVGLDSAVVVCGDRRVVQKHVRFTSEGIYYSNILYRANSYEYVGGRTHRFVFTDEFFEENAEMED